MNTESVPIKIQNLSLSFGTTQVLRDISLEIEPGEFFAFLGPSGSGKSTLLRAVAGFGPTPSGSILLGDIEISSLPPWERNVGMVFQSYALWPHMTVRKNVGFGLEERKLPKRELGERVDRALDMVGLLELAERRPSQLSGGQQQRVALARTVVIEPRVLLLDEPLSNLDANLRVQMRRDIRALQQRLHLTTIFVTHDQEEANTTADRMAVLNDGVLQQIGTPLELYDNPVNLFVARFLGTANILQGEIEEANGQVTFRSANGVTIPLDTPDRGQRSIVIRPQNVTLSQVGESVDEGIILQGQVAHSEFHGSIVRYTVNVNGDALLVDSSHQQGERPFAFGVKVNLALQKEKILSLKTGS